MFLGALAFVARAAATTARADVVKIQRVDATCGDPTAVVNAWDFSRNGENKSTEDFCWNFPRFQFLRWFLSAFDLFSFVLDWINNRSRPKRSNATWINERQLNSIRTYDGNWIIWKSFLWSSLSTFIGKHLFRRSSNSKFTKLFSSLKLFGEKAFGKALLKAFEILLTKILSSHSFLATKLPTFVGVNSTKSIQLQVARWWENVSSTFPPSAR